MKIHPYRRFIYHRLTVFQPVVSVDDNTGGQTDMTAAVDESLRTYNTNKE